MNHPTREAWLAHLYADEAADPAEAARLRQHLSECAECRADVARWQAVLGGLDQWRIAPQPLATSAKGARWRRGYSVAASVAVLLTVGFFAGRGTAASKDEVAALRAQLAALETGLDSRVRSAAVAETKEQLKPFATAVGDQLRDLRTEQAANYLSLRKELETVAVFTAAGFRQTESSLVQLANSSSPSARPDTLQ